MSAIRTRRIRCRRCDMLVLSVDRCGHCLECQREQADGKHRWYTPDPRRIGTVGRLMLKEAK